MSNLPVRERNLDNHSTISCKKTVRRYICGL
nr:MAG TPA: Invasion protein B family [Caudoviricetes sp.]